MWGCYGGLGLSNDELLVNSFSNSMCLATTFLKNMARDLSSLGSHSALRSLLATQSVKLWECRGLVGWFWSSPSPVAVLECGGELGLQHVRHMSRWPNSGSNKAEKASVMLLLYLNAPQNKYNRPICSLFEGIWRHSKEFEGIRRHSKEFEGIRRHSKEFEGIRRHSKEFDF